MKKSTKVLPFFAVVLATGLVSRSGLAMAPAWSEARTALLAGSPDTLEKYHRVAADSADAGLVAEYALALIFAGWGDASLFELDRATLLDPGNDGARFVAPLIFAALGRAEVADELRRPAPPWTESLQPLPTPPQRPLGNFDDEILAASALMQQARYVTAVDRLGQITTAYPNQSLGWSAYAIALEKLGAYRCAAHAVEAELALPDLDPNDRELLVSHQHALETAAPYEPLKPNEALRGKYVLFAGGGLSHAAGAFQGYAMAQAGKFITSRISVNANMGYATGADFNFGLGARYHQPLPIDLPINVTFGTRFDVLSAGPSFDWVLSPGASYFLGDSSVDLIVDVGVLGPLQGVVTMSLGYTMYFGGLR